MARQGSGAMLASGGLGFPPQNMARVVVWEWLNEHGRWRPSSAAVCHHIENVLKEDARGSVVLGQVDVQLAPYVIDLQSMHQFRQDTGTMRPVRRNFYDPSSAPGKGIVWEWENDNSSWTPYDMDICITIQNAYEKQHPWLDLSSLGFCYLIYFSSMSQMNRQTQRKRRLRRRMDLAYPLTMGSIPKSQSWPVGASTGTPCSCPQCLLVNSPRAASNAILASQRRKLYPGAVRQSSTFAGAALWPAGTGTGTAAVAGGTTKGEGLRGTGGAFAPSRAAGRGVPRPPGLAGWDFALSWSPSLSPSPYQHAGPIPHIPMDRVPALPVKNLNGTGPVHPALAGMTGILMCAAGLPVCLTRAPKPILHPPPVSKSDIKPVPGVNGICRKTKKKHLKKSKTPEDVVRRYIQKVKNPPDEDCTICMERLVTSSGYEGVLSHRGIKPELVGKLGKCGHMYHLLCLLAMYNNGNKDGSLQCPTCKAIYGEKTGTQPPGKMEFHLIPHSLPGYTDSKTIRIVYDIPTGIQGPEHPNPGKKFTARGFPRHCYLPDNEKGRKVLKLLIVAWDRRLIFTIGTSNTTGESDTVVWNEIHHKTEFGSNLTGHGYPDPNYLDNVLAELLAQGVSEATLKD
ncbi:E3 ubiquitin-protein ligase DTX1 [Egretta garzetta]|uniref:E3 ubiquitin-protein ligase DTX1 n=1 Tax=Egretta garzetta TaxID=188379 RepID=UPI00163D1CA1|nr:E3 ubiquitin-protein ligase DTX1 [Egretta garzetta]